MRTLKILFCTSLLWSSSIVSSSFSNLAFAHEGNLDDLGCHYGKSKYHCHRGELEGKTFSTSGEARRLLDQIKKPNNNLQSNPADPNKTILIDQEVEAPKIFPANQNLEKEQVKETVNIYQEKEVANNNFQETPEKVSSDLGDFYLPANIAIPSSLGNYPDLQNKYVLAYQTIEGDYQFDLTSINQQRQSLLERQDNLQDIMDGKARKKENKKIEKSLKQLQSEEEKLEKPKSVAIAKLEKDFSGEVKDRKKAEKFQLKQNQKLYGLGPYPEAIETFVVDKPLSLKKFYKALYIEGERNAVLNFNRLGLAAMESGEFWQAEWAFDQALLRIESIYADNREAKKSRSKFKEEKIKDFKGDSYERAMSYYYRGLLYLRVGDYENARASFKSGEYQDTVSETETFQSDFTILDYLSGWASMCNGDPDLADDFFSKAEQYANVWGRPINRPARGENVLMIAELGKGPIKYGAGEYKELLTFKKNQTTNENSVIFEKTVSPENDKSLYSDVSFPATKFQYNGILATDLYQQATTRGGREFDNILEGKANYKTKTKKASKTLTTAGSATLLGTSSNAGSYAGGALLLGGLVAGLLSAKAKPAADARYWETLPNTIHLATVSDKKIQIFSNTYNQSFKVSYLTPGGNYISEPREFLMSGSTNSCSFYWTRATSSLDTAESSPDARLTWKQAKKRKDAAQAGDVQFRNYLDNNALRENY